MVGIDPLRRTGAQGMTVANLFSGWDPDALGQLAFTDAAADTSICRNSHILGQATFPLEHWLRRAVQGAIGARDPMTDKIGAVGVSENEFRSLSVRLHLAARAINDLGPCRLSRQSVRWIQEFKPAVIYSCLGNARTIKIAMIASQAAGDIPIVPHFMDDWPSTLYADGTLWSIPRRAVRRLLQRLFQRAPFGFCIGAAMAREYKRRFQREFHGFMNCVEDSEFARKTVARRDSAPPGLVWTYVGGLHLNRWKALAPIAECVKAAGGALRIFAPEQDIRKHRLSPSALAGAQVATLAPNDVMDALRESDVLIHVESFDHDESAFTRLSVSTKLAQYLSSGRPILGFGPAGLASLELIENANAGLTVTSEAQQTLAAAVNRLARDSDLRRGLSQNGLAYAREHFMKSAVCSRFQSMLQLAGMTCNQQGRCGGSDGM
jgi:glycosyltransferase involved in cell wall biosynthesis